MKKIISLLLIVQFFSTNANSQELTQNTNSEKMEWFNDAKLGIFIHWGIYSVNGISESWSFYRNKISYKDYMKQLDGFTANNYDPNQWAELFKEAGAKYAVLTSKHHDGVALWDTKQNNLSVVKKTPAKRDLLSPYAKALRDQGLKVGVYYSHLDWSHPDYATVYNGGKKPGKLANKYDFPESDKKVDEKAWNKFVEFRDAQAYEIAKLVNPDLWWFDGSWTRTVEQWKMQAFKDSLLSWNPNTILNGRMAGLGDYKTPEQGLPIFGPDGPWELCMTINDSWGYRGEDQNHKSLQYIIRVFIETISQGGNLLLDIGPKPDGTITEVQQDRLKGLGRWTNKHSEAIYGTRRGLPFGHVFAPTTLSKDNKTLYCFILDTPKDGVIIKGIRNKVKQISVVGTNETLEIKRNGGAPWKDIPGVLKIDIPVDKLDENVTVIAIELDSPIKLYRGKGGPIEQN